MLVVLMCLMMKILEFSSGSLIDTERLIVPNACRKKKQKRRRKGLGVGRGMTTVDELSLSPASDCNSNNVDASYASTTSDAEFIQDNYCDYQWFPDCGYREIHHRSVLSSCYDEMARDLDSQLAQVDMEDYSAQDILSTFPAMCCGEMPGERQGEMYASVSGSLMVKFEFDSSISPHTSSQDESSMSLGQSEPLFSPVKEAPLFPTNYSVDSLDCEDQDHLIVTCQANKHNYTIAFHGSTVMEDSKSELTEGADLENDTKKPFKMAASDAPTTTWSKLRKIPPRHRTRSKTVSLPDLAPPNKLSTSFALGQKMKLYDIQNSSSATSESFSGSGDNSGNTHKQGNFSLLRMFIAQRNNMEQANDNAHRTTRNNKHVRNSNELGSMTDTAWLEEDLSACYEDSLVRDNSADEPESSSVERLSSKSISICSCSLSTSLNKFNVNNNNSFEREPKRHNVKVGTSGSELSDPTSSSEQTGTVKVVATERKCPIHCVDRSMQTSTLQTIHNLNHKEQDKKSEDKKPVYILYPNYTLPDLGFLRKNSLDLDRVLLTPLKYSGGNTPQTPPASHAPYRTVTRQDVEMLRKKGLSHVMDLTSLTPLLPSEYWSVLTELPQIKQHSGHRFENTRPIFCMTPTQNKEYPPFPDGKTNVNSSGCSTGTAPSSGYRGSSTLLNESGGNGNPLYVYNYGSEEKLKGKKKTSDILENKRYSMFEFDGVEEEYNEIDEKGKKRKSFPDNHTGLKDNPEKDIWEDWWKDSKHRPHSPPSAHAQRLDQLIEISGHEQWQPHDIHTLRDQVSKFLCEVGRKCVSFADKNEQQCTPPNSPTYQKYQGKQPGLGDLHLHSDSTCRSGTTENKKALIDGVVEAVDKIINYGEENNSQLVLDTLCPTLYALLSDGLKYQLETPFGPIGNSVWQVVEASAQQGPMTRALHELVMKLNSEDILSEGLVKFNAFIFGLLNVRGMDAWISYIRTRESILSKHYVEDSILLAASKGHAISRGLSDQLIATLKPLAQYNFSLDLLYETRQLHESLLQLARVPISPSQNIELTTDSILLKRIVQSIRSGLGNFSSGEQSQTSESKSSRPRSCVDTVGGGDCANTARKRWSGVQVGSRLANAFEKLQTDEDFPDSLETGGKSSSEETSEKEIVKDDDKVRGGKFRSLQRKWELLSGKDTTSSDLSPMKTNTSRSRIPRPVTSPVRPQSSKLPTLVSNQQRRIPTPLTCARPRVDSGRAANKIQRPSRVDSTQEKVITSRPSSLPYRPPGNSTKVQRRAASSSTVRKSDRPAGTRHVVTLTHRLPSDSGHLAFNEGERLRLVLEVDDVWLLCCRGDQKGLVPRSAVI
ncbi:uncharacterized protein LOC106663610 [Cimex lectularius]|uniref:Iporin n=1 Tax=Cimex lectularius TaxID=79782 RepID=A0A8I6RFR3_CIMLE|nr:uncharacterized protein LOC106663610 [Cimex lectularius]